MTFFISICFQITCDLSKVIIKRSNFFLEIFKKYFFVLISSFDKLFNDEIKISRNFLCLFLIKLFMLVYESLKILKTFLKFGNDELWLVEVKELLNFENVIRMVRYMKGLFEFALFADFTIFFTVLHRAYEQYVRILMFRADKLLLSLPVSSVCWIHYCRWIINLFNRLWRD